MGRRACTEPQFLYKGDLYSTFNRRDTFNGLPYTHTHTPEDER